MCFSRAYYKGEVSTYALEMCEDRKLGEVSGKRRSNVVVGSPIVRLNQLVTNSLACTGKQKLYGHFRDVHNKNKKKVKCKTDANKKINLDNQRMRPYFALYVYKVNNA